MLVDSTGVLRNLIEHFVQLGSTGYRAAFECLVGGLCHVFTRSSCDYSVASLPLQGTMNGAFHSSYASFLFSETILGNRIH